MAPSEPRRLFTTKEAAAYCRFKTTGAIRKAVKEGRLCSLGKRAGRGTHLFEQGELDRYLFGSAPAQPALTISASTPKPKPQRRGPGRPLGASSAAALERIRELARSK